VQAHELQAFGGDDVAAFSAARGRERGRIFRQSERRYLDAAVSGFTNGAACVPEGPTFEDFAADSVAEAGRHASSIVMGDSQYGRIRKREREDKELLDPNQHKRSLRGLSEQLSARRGGFYR
jgi:hypothetical protein